MRRPSLRSRLAIAFTVLVAAILVAVGVLTFQLLRQSLLEEIGRDVTSRATTFQRASNGPPYQLDVFGEPDVFLQVVDPSGSVMDRSANLGDRTLPLPPEAREGGVVEVEVADRPLFLTAAPLDDGGHVIVARSPVSTYGALGTLRTLLTLVVACAVVMTALASWFYARAALRPIGRVVEAAREIRDSRDLARRVPRRGTRDEVGRLVETFNEMLTELEGAHASLDRSNHQLRQFLADCSHELRAPLSRIRSAIDLLGRLEPDASADDDGFRSQTLSGIAAETDRMARMVRQLLILARADAGATIEPRLIRLSEVLDAVCRQADQMANGLTLVLPRPELLGDAVVRGNADHLEQVVLILLDNAVKYTPAPGQVRLEVDRDEARATISVADTGLGVPDEDAERIFDRFYRGRNAQAATGTGLGLAIAHWVVEQHGGRIELVTGADTGARFSVQLPLVREDES